MNSTRRIFSVLSLSVMVAAGLVSISACSPSQTESASVEAPTQVMADGAILVSNKAAFAAASADLQAGQSIVLANGTWQDFEILLKGKGTAEQPIKLSAQTPGQVILSGQSNLSLQGEYLEVSGLVFKNGYSPTGAVISFRGDAKNLAYHSRVSHTVIDGFSNTDKFNSDSWVNLYGQHNRFDHNHLVGKSNAGVTMAVRLGSVDSQENYHKIDHNYFGPRPILGSNGGETLRIGTSKYSLIDSYTVVENNYFDRANGEVEIISNKSGRNQFKNNVFFESRGTLTLRHGNHNLVEGNVFFGNGKDHTGGIRVINANQTIRNNYMEGLTGIRFGGGFVVLNGVPNSSINRYHQVKEALIENNTIVNVSNINLAAGSDAERSATPIDSTFKNNLVVNETAHPFKIFDDVSGIAFGSNLSNQAMPASIADGFEIQPISLSRNQQGLLVSEAAGAKNIGADLALSPIKKEDTGVAWYPKSEPSVAFESGQTVNVDSTETLVDAMHNANDGDHIILAPGKYDLNKQLQVSKVVSISGQAGQDTEATTLFPMRSLMIEIEDGGSLRLQNLVINGEKSPDSAGNVLIRNSRMPTLLNYRIELVGINVVNLNVNHSAHVFDAGYRTLADHITITDSQFSDITGDILRLDKEQDDLGIYNIEYLTIENSSFANIEGAIAKIYRGGTDESTFGPHVFMTNNSISNVGGGKRNKSGAMLYLHGVQDTDLVKNAFSDSKPIIIEHTVGEPQTLIEQNVFKNVTQPRVTELFTGGESTAVLLDNTYTNK